MRVLVADDCRIQRMILRRIMEGRGLEVIEATDGIAALAVLLQGDPPELAILDWMMPGLTGPKVCELVRSRGEDRAYTYLLLLTGLDRTEDLAEGLDSGADDYLSKPFEHQELEARVKVGERTARLHSALAKARGELWEQSVKDSLTGIWNRRGILERLDAATENAAGLSLILMDIDFFKRINDRYGHPAGDAVLRAVAQRVSHGLRESDEVGRFGGEEFLVILPGADERQAKVAAERIRRMIANDPIRIDGDSIDVTSSFGVATSENGGTIDVAALVSAADCALYQAKENGRNRVESGTDQSNIRYFPEVALAG